MNLPWHSVALYDGTLNIPNVESTSRVLTTWMPLLPLLALPRSARKYKPRFVSTVATSKAGVAHFSFVALQGPTRLRVTTAAKAAHGPYLVGTSPSVVVTGVGNWRGEGLALLERVK